MCGEVMPGSKNICPLKSCADNSCTILIYPWVGRPKIKTAFGSNDFNFNTVIIKYLQNLKKERDIDYIYFEILMNLFGKTISISDEDRKRIEKAKKNLKM